MKLTRLLPALLGLFTLSLSAAEKPDVLFIAVDDLNDWVGHLKGHPQARTPNIDRLVARGTTFTNAHCAAPACNPSRAALMSGLRPWQTGIYTNDDPAGGVMKDTLTLNRHFLAQGYNTQGGGKIYHGGPSEGREDTWTKWMGLFDGTKNHEGNMNGLNNGHFDWGPLDSKTEEMGDYKLTDWAINELKTAPTDKPLFLAVGYVKPHLPWYVPKEYFDRFPLDSIQLPLVKEDDIDDLPKAGLNMAKPAGDHAAVIKANQWKQAVQAYLATISFLDDQVGRLLDGLDASPRKDKTIIVWWTDHGWALGEKQHWRKFALWEETTRTSCAIVVPGMTQPGSVCAAPVDYLNIYPTLCEVTGLPLPEHVKGASLVPLLKDPKAAWDHVAICSHGRGNHAVRDAQWRYIRYADGSEELYDHTKDPNEWTNLAGEVGMSDIKTKLATSLPAADSEVPAVAKKKEGKKGKGDGKNKGKKKKADKKKTEE
ncbi:arylsulfatase A-like enzyme [Prosthecobacter fusiformis]|uniref:Arylsulfatase A-like enzyme n=1 Tax=Prosthecobacter fusiformis TaxID=48464 RepID=A0A4R7RZV3_9BACT|nr:sulfatase [Prosthecobacter fusiformis]TDU70638.1 arylsulfatase A-like enzyme [Prosthecobacter fusiformis]